MLENERLLPDQPPREIKCRLIPQAARALDRLRAPGNRRGEITRIINRLLINEEVREETRRATIRGSLYGIRKRRGRKAPATAA
jgi:hypothetical protein